MFVCKTNCTHIDHYTLVIAGLCFVLKIATSNLEEKPLLKLCIGVRAIYKLISGLFKFTRSLDVSLMMSFLKSSVVCSMRL